MARKQPILKSRAGHRSRRDRSGTASSPRRFASRAVSLAGISAERAPEAVRQRLGHQPSVDRWVVCHGDACAPNTLLDTDGRLVAHVDLGALGIADRWADLAVASLSLEWNFGHGYESTFFHAYGIEPDPERIAFYRLLSDLTP
ncbi:MAG: phosphotransferase [Ornithinimicrobium sp.]